MSLFKFKFRGFWNDNEGLSVSDVSTLCTLPLYLFVAVKYAIASDLSPTQVDFFSSLTYVILLAVGGKAIERFGFPNLRNRNNNNYNGYNGNYSDYNDYYNDNYYNNRNSNNQNNIIINKTNPNIDINNNDINDI